jgi:hypothetical protein
MPHEATRYPPRMSSRAHGRRDHRSSTLLAVTLAGTGAGVASLEVVDPAARAAAGAVFLAAFVVVCAVTTRRVLGSEPDATDSVLVGLGTATAVATFALLALAAVGHLTSTTSTGTLVVLHNLLGLGGYATGAHVKPVRWRARSQLRAPAHLVAGILLAVAVALGFLSMRSSLHAFRTDGMPLASVSLSMPAGRGPAMIDVHNMSGGTETGQVQIRVGKRVVAGTDFSVEAGEDRLFSVPSLPGMARPAITVAVRQDSRTQTLTLSDGVAAPTTPRRARLL